MSRIVRRDVCPLLQDVRNFLLGRTLVNPLRFEDGIAARTQPPPTVPGGPAHKFSANYYVTRDPRREVGPPTILAEHKKNLLAAPAEKRAKLPTPGQLYDYGQHN